MSQAALIYPHQLFKEHPAFNLCEKFYLIEDPLFFRQYKFHKQKLILHRATMKMYSDYLTSKGKVVSYVSAFEIQRSEEIFNLLGDCKEAIYVNVDDCWLERRLEKGAKSRSIDLNALDSPLFISDLESCRAFFKKKKKFFMGSFYQEQRKRFNILLDGKGPVGGKWSYDSENRKKLPKNIAVPTLPKHRVNNYLKEAKEYVAQYFPDNPGNGDTFVYPITFKQARNWLTSFLEQRFRFYGDYQDAIAKDETYLFHSVLTPVLNIGILTPHEIIEHTLNYAESNELPLNSLEGFIRQIIGWREYVRTVYDMKGVEERTKNFWNHSRKIPDSFWTASTGIEPVDVVIQRVLDSGYSHHIERLMVLGNFMLLCEFDPDEVYRWFMELFIDSYDWVMVPNVYGMSQYADGGLMSTKPYISSSNYIKKMSDFRTDSWCEIWDGLYWRFIHKHRNFFSKNPRLSMMVHQLNKMTDQKLKQHLIKANEFLSELDN